MSAPFTRCYRVDVEGNVTPTWASIMHDSNAACGMCMNRVKLHDYYTTTERGMVLCRSCAPFITTVELELINVYERATMDPPIITARSWWQRLLRWLAGA